MARWHPSKCRSCGIEAADNRTISARGYCLACGTQREKDNIVQLATREGPFYEHWLRRSFLAYRRQLIAANQLKG